MFMKYFIGIQKAIAHLAKGHPLKFLMLVLGQEALVDIPDPTDAHLLNKNYEMMLYNPIETLINTATPGSVHFLKSVM
jgi:hypothetical protein